MSGDAALLNCPVCLNSGSFENIEMLRNRLQHIATHNIICPVCQNEISGLENLIRHLFDHIKLKDSQYGQISNKLNKLNKRSHISECKANTETTPIAINKQEYSPCNNDQIAFNCLDTNHNNDNTEEKAKEKEETVCKICGLHFMDQNILKIHLNLIHDINDKVPQEMANYRCHLCSKSFKMRGSLMVHFRVAHFGFISSNRIEDGGEIKANGVKGLPSTAIDELDQNCLNKDNKQWQCDICKKFFTTKYFLKKHKRLHTGETPYACSQCTKTFTFQQSYHKHLLYHNDEKPHSCNVCGRAFKELSTLHNHQRIHTGEKPFSCETCGKSFRQRVSYLVHRRIHTGAMPYKCTACDKTFRYKVSQRTHKCQVQPPGTVIRKTGDLIEKLKKKSIKDRNQAQVDAKLHPNMTYNEISEAHVELVRSSAKLSFEDTECDNFNLLEGTITQQHANDSKQTHQSNIDPIDELINSMNVHEGECSPSYFFKNLCLTQDEMQL